MLFLECRNIEKKYKDFCLSLSFSVNQGELVSIIGPSGSGKSTLLSLVCGIDSPDSGSIFLDGRDITGLEIQKRGIGMVFQDFSLFSSMNVGENIRYGMKDMDKEEMKKETQRLLELVGLAGYEKRRVHELSGGEAQRIALARSLAAKPQILLLDEPLSALDAPLRKRLRTVIRDIHRSTGVTMLYVTHDREEAFAISDRIVIMKDGHIMAEGTPEELYRRPTSLFTAFFTGEGTAIPMSCITGKPSEKHMFFRPEDIVLSTEPCQDPNRTVLENARVIDCEYSGSGYVARLDFKGHVITACTRSAVAGKTVNAIVDKDKVLELD